MATRKLSDKALVTTLGDSDSLVAVLANGNNRRITKTNLRTEMRGLPAYSAADNGKVLSVVNGTPAWTAMPSAIGVQF